MKKWLALLTVILTAAAAVAQSIPASQSRVAGRFVAYNYGLWNTYPASISPATGLQTFTVLNSYVNLGDGRLISPYSTNAALRIGTETVTPSAVSTCYVNDVRIGVCQITATFTLSHTNSDKISSATFGLQEALNDAGNSGGGAVTVDSAWAGVGGTTAIISGATIPANTSIEDARTGVPAGPGAVTPSLQYSMFYQPNSGTAAAAVGDPSITTDGAGNLHAGTVAAATAVAAVFDKGGHVYNVLAYGADNTGATCAQDKIQAAINAAGGAPVVVPTGKYLLCAPLYAYTLPGIGGWAPGLKLSGSGYGRTQFLLSQSSFVVPATVTVGGTAVATYPAAIDIQGTVSAANFGRFQSGANVSGLEITPQGCEVNPSVSEPACAMLSTAVAGISVEGCWKCSIHENWISYMSSDAIVYPYFSWIGIDPDWWASAENDVTQNHLVNNKGWGINFDGFDGVTFITARSNQMVLNWAGGVRDTGWANRIIDNGIGSNGCGPAIAGTSGSHITCVSSPLGQGILVDRAYGGGGPLLGRIEGNTLDSNAAQELAIRAGSNFLVRKNLMVAHVSGYTFNDSFPGAQNVPKTSILLGSGTGAINTTITDNQQRSDFQCAGGYPVPSAGCGFGNVLMDPEEVSINLGSSDQSANLVNQNYFRGYTNASTYQPYTSGAGVVAGYPVMNGGGTSVSSWSLLNGGVGEAVAPTITVWGGDSAFASPTLVTLTQSGGVLSGCTLRQAGGPYNRMPAIAVGDNQNIPGTGGAFSLTLSGGASGTPTACAITSGGSGYKIPLAGVAPQCAVPPVITATASNGIDYISVSNGGNYGPWTPGATPPTVTATVSDGTGTGYSVRAIVRAVNTNTNPATSPTVIWQVVGVVVISRGYSSTAPTIAFSSGATVTPAVASVILGHVLNIPLTVTSGGTCDAGAALGMVLQYPTIASSNTLSNLVSESNSNITSPPPSPVSQSTISNMTFWNSGLTTMYLEQGTTPNSSNGVALLNVLHDTDGTNFSGLSLDASHGVMEIYPFNSGTDPAVPMYIFAPTGQPLELGANATLQYEVESNGDIIPVGSNTLPNLGSAAHPMKDEWLGPDSTHNVHFDTSALTAANRVIKFVDSTTQNPVVPLGSASGANFVQWIDSSGVQHLGTPAVAGAPPTTVFSLTAPVSNTGSTTNNQIINTAKIPAGTMSATGKIAINIWFGACLSSGIPGGCSVVNTGTCTPRVFLGTTNVAQTTNISGAVAIGIHQSEKLEASMRAQNSTTSEQVDNFLITSGASSTGVQVAPQTFNTANDLYVNVLMQNSVAGDTCFVTQMDIVNWP